MHSFAAAPANSHYTARIHPALATGFAEDIGGTLARLIAYLCTLALIAILGIYLWDQLPGAEPELATKNEWILAARSAPAFAVSQFDLSYKTDAYQILRHPEGGRKDVLRWTGPDGKPAAELEIYRPGGELSEAMPAMAEIAGRIDPDGVGQIEAAGIIDSKFGAVTLLRLSGDTDGNHSCLGFLKRLDQPNLRLSGWSCQGDTLPARSAQKEQHQREETTSQTRRLDPRTTHQPENTERPAANLRSQTGVCEAAFGIGARGS